MLSEERTGKQWSSDSEEHISVIKLVASREVGKCLLKALGWFMERHKERMYFQASDCAFGCLIGESGQTKLV